ncbi:MAG: DUF928 domain-containing protein [Cyanobacteria bacterium P01_D01_bin.73]
MLQSNTATTISQEQSHTKARFRPRLSSISRLLIGAFGLSLLAAPEAIAAFESQGDKAPTWSGAEMVVATAKRSRVRFIPPDDARPRTTVGSGSRGRVRFAPPSAPAPRTTVGSGSRGRVRFAPPSAPAPSSTVGAGSRGRIRFAPPNAPAPTTTVGTGSRESVELDALALLPPGSYTQTRSDRPSLMLYLPETGADRAFISVQGLDSEYNYQAEVSLKEDNGIAEVSLPSTAPNLEAGQEYLWQVVLLAPGEQLAPDTPVLRTFMARVAADFPVGSVSPNGGIAERLTPAIALEQAVDLAEAGLWIDTLQVLADARRLNPDNTELAEEWSDLLVQVGLGDVASAPLLSSEATAER